MPKEYAALSEITTKGTKRDKEVARVSYAAVAEYKRDISNKFPVPKLSTQFRTT
jgi:hypothetical protein